ncbi:Crp/Fnr family transcriptional regulator [Sphingosinicella sp. CPCC 101087]|uniref:Crp/Fnr family transcriptional regulator n=1 Tax=Sphingosinicella sp. CPCC 101087 TaxID=2497754 RepID=UPI0019814CF2|nr:Crp/Fnr family transcriptional regulator [Sphingosinicella sp. CPCC 101087]
MTNAKNPLAPLLANLEVRTPLGEEDRQAILALPYTLKTLEPSTYTVREGDPPDRCGVLVSGFAYRQKLTGDGDRQIIAIHIPGDATDFQNSFLEVADHSVQMLTRGDVAFIPRGAIQEIVRSRAAIAHAILIKILVEASIFREWVLNVGRRNARTRMAHVLCEFALRLEAEGVAGRNGYELPMTQEQLADALGLTPVHVNRVLKGLEADGLIKRSKRNVSFPDWERLRQVGDFNQRYLHLERQSSGQEMRIPQR